MVILAHDIGKILTFSNFNDQQPHDIPAADIVASLPELRTDFNEVTARAMILAIRHQHAKAEIPLDAPPLTDTIVQFIKKADLMAAAEESREAAVQIRDLLPMAVEKLPFIIGAMNINSSMGGKADGYLAGGYVYLLKEALKARLLSELDVRNAPVFKGQDPVWNEMALALTEAGMIVTKIGDKEAGKKSCLFTIKTPRGQEKAVALPVDRITPRLISQWLQAQPGRIEVL